MADCPYARCIQERRHIRRELLRWTKNMVFVVGLERVAEELMGRRRWKQYQDTLYSSTRSESASQPHHRLHPALSTACSNQAAGNVSQIGTQYHHRQASTGSQLQQPSTTPPISATVITATTTTTPTIGQEHTLLQQKELANHKETNDIPCRIRPEDIKLEIEAAQEVNTVGIRSELLQQGEISPLTRIQNIKNENGEEEDFNEKKVINETQESAEKRLKLDDSLRNTVSPLRENERSPSRHSRANEGTDTAGTKDQSVENVLERIQVTAGLLRVKKEEELQELPQQVNCGGNDTTRIDTEINRQITKEQSDTTNDCTLTYPVNRRVSPPPEDWKPLDKCYFCLDGKLPHDDQAPLSPQSESSSSSRSAESPMSVQVDPMAASAVVAAALSGTYPTLLPQWVLPPREAPLVGIQTHQDTGQSADQPLDLSSKPKNSQDNNISMLEQQKISLRMPANIDPKAIFTTSYRPKPRLPGQTGAGGVPVVGGGRRTYTEEELQAALRDIQSGKLGTRRAAVIYGIPRSTLRNKVYKLAMERERDASLTSTHTNNPHESGVPVPTTTITSTLPTSTTTASTPNTIQNASATSPTPQVDEFDTWPLGVREIASNEADDKELSGAEEEKEVEKALLKPLLSLEDLVRFSALEGGGSDSLRNLLQRGHETGTEWPGFEHANIGPYIQKMLAAAAPFKGLETQEYRIPEVMRRLMSEDKRLNKDVNGDQSHSHGQSPQSLQGSQQQRLPMTNDDFNPAIEEEASDSAQGRAILKIPSYKPAGTPGSSKNNGEPNSAAFAQGFAASSSAAGSPGLLERVSPAFSGTSSPTNSLVGKGVSVNFRDVIAKSISSKFQEGQSGQTNVSQTPTSMLSDNPFKRGRYTPPQSGQQQQSQQQKSQSHENKSKQSAGGKGTRPKRGKYRNYDRDSLVEAVRAVQRGEMSVHRAGSYYGVPHSTLEYKVKERHLMRPRKRDQKQSEDKAKESTTTPSTLRPAHQDKKPPLKPQKPFTPGPGGMPGGPNGLKMPFLEGMPHLPFPHPFNFGWGPGPFMPSPFIPGTPNVPTILPEQYFATQRMRGLQEQQRSAAIVQQQNQQQSQSSQQQQQQQQQQQSSSNRDGAGGEAGMSNSRSMVKSTRDMAESLYEGAGANGSFLDNLIRSSLETGIPRDQRGITDGRGQAQTHPETMSSKALIDQLCRNSRRTPLPRMTDSSEDESYRPSRNLPDRPERVPTVDLSPSPTERIKNDEHSSDRLTSPPTPMSISRTGSRDDDTRDSRIDIGSRERDVHNGGDELRNKTMIQQQLNHYSDIQNIYTEKKSACDSKLIVDHSSQNNQQQQQQTQQPQQKEFGAVSGLVVQLQRGYNAASNARSSEQNQQNNTQSVAQPVQESQGPALTMEDSVEQ